MIKERRGHPRFPVIHNVGEPIELDVVINQKKICIPGYIINLSASGISIMTLGKQSSELHVGVPFVMTLKLPNLVSQNLEGEVVRIQKGSKAILHHSNDEWFLSLQFKKIKPAHQKLINRMAEDWSICETKIQMNLPDICFHECAYWNLCEKPAKLKEKKPSPG